MRNIIIVEAASTGINFIEDIIKRGYNPIVFEMKIPDNDAGIRYKSNLESCYNEIKHDFEMIYEQDSFEKTVEIVKKYDPLLILPGSEKGVGLATKLSHELNLLGNPIENIEAMTLKNEMQKRISEHGLRSIRGQVITSLDEAIDFYDNENLNEVVIKPTLGMGSSSVRICLNRDEMIKNVEGLFNRYSRFGENLNKLLIQERIKGDEYIVNTVSCQGIPRVTLIWKYNKVRTSEGAFIYDSCESVDELDIGEAEMVEYAYDVAKAMGIEYGPVHGEYMIDENGPVLIEVNCRPCGGSMPADFLDKISGQHETDSILDSYLKPKRFEELLKRKYKLYSNGALKFFIVPEEIIARSSPVNSITSKLNSFHSGHLSSIDGYKQFIKTEDVSSSPGTIFLLNKDKSILHENLNFLRKIEKHAFSLVLSENKEKKNEIDSSFNLKNFIDTVDKYGTGILVTDENLNNNDILNISPEEISNLDSTFDYILINLTNSIIENEDENVNLFLNIFSKVKTGGYIFIPDSTYNLLPDKRKEMEGIIKALNYSIVLPPYNIRNIIIATRN